jgi:hypothetical protein
VAITPPSADLVEQAYRQMAELIIPDAELPEYVFRDCVTPTGYTSFLTVFQNRYFFADLQTFLQNSGVPGWWFLSMNPSREYYEQHFGFAPAYFFSNSDEYSTYREMYERDPGGSPADAVWARALKFCILPVSSDWIIYVDRDFELAVFAAKEAIQEGGLVELIKEYGERHMCDVGKFADVGSGHSVALMTALFNTYQARENLGDPSDEYRGQNS